MLLLLDNLRKHRIVVGGDAVLQGTEGNVEVERITQRQALFDTTNVIYKHI